MSNQIPIIDISALINDTELKDEVCQQINKALRESGFFYIIGHGVSDTILEQMDSLSRLFFALPLDEKLKVRNTDSGVGYFGVGDTKTGGKIDIYEGIQFVPEEPNKIISKYKQNLYPDIPKFRETVQTYLDQMSSLGHKLIEGISLSLNLDKHYLAERYTAHEPSVAVSVLHYPPISDGEQTGVWGLGEHTDYGFLTILKQDNSGGLQVKCKNEWIDATPVDHSFVCNIGDALQVVTGGLYKSNWHRVKSPTNSNRISIPVFFHPYVNSYVKRIDGVEAIIEDNGNDVSLNEYYEFTGTFGDYVKMKRKKSYSIKN